MPPINMGDSEQFKMIADSVAESAVAKFAIQHPELRQKEIPAPIKWAGGIIAAIMVFIFVGGLGWLVTTVNDMQLTLARMDERMQSQANARDVESVSVDRRISRLEAVHGLEN